jgi:uncharacterized membrane protein YhaH (DUF805 family)
MIYKFIDKNGSEITVNSLSSLQALVDSETVKEDTKVKAGLRGKWTTASKIDELILTQEIEEEIEETSAPKGDIKSFITEEKNNEETSEKELEEDSIQPWQTKSNPIIAEEVLDNVEEINDSVEEKKSDPDIEDEEDEVEKERKSDPDIEDEEDEVEQEEKSEYELEEEKRDKTYDDENVIGLTFGESVSTCLKKYFNFKDRASRSEYWYFQLLILPIFIWTQFPSDDNQILVIQLVLTFGLIIPAMSSGVRRFHDKDKSGWFILISIIPIIGSIIILIMLSDKGTEGPNRFGKYPLKLKK